MVPVAMVELDEAHAALGQPPRQQAVVGERAGLARVRAVEVETCSRLLRDRSVSSGTDDCIRNAISYCAMRVAISGIAVVRRASRWLICASASRYTRRFCAVKPGGVREIQHRIADRAELHALIARRQKAAAPQPVVERLAAAAAAGRDHDDKRRQVLRSRRRARKTTHDPMLGRPAICEPVCRKVTAGS